MRASEIRNLTWAQVDFFANALTVRKSKTVAGTGRLIPLVRVDVRVRSPRIVALHIVSHPLEGGQTHFIKRHVIRGRDACNRQCRSAEVFVWLEQVRKIGRAKR
jgi:integrase